MYSKLTFCTMVQFVQLQVPLQNNFKFFDESQTKLFNVTPSGYNSYIVLRRTLYTVAAGTFMYMYIAL